MKYKNEDVVRFCGFSADALEKYKNGNSEERQLYSNCVMNLENAVLDGEIESSEPLSEFMKIDGVSISTALNNLGRIRWVLSTWIKI